MSLHESLTMPNRRERRASKKSAQKKRPVNPPKLRDYQLRTIESLYASYLAGCRRALVVLPTGAGKSVIAAALAYDLYCKGKRLIIIAHRGTILTQLRERFIAAGIPEADVGVVWAGGDREHLNPTAKVQIASVMTLANRDWPKADVVMVDEAHRALAETYVEIAARFPKAWHIGFTATPYRFDGQPLRKAYDQIIIEATYAELIAADVLSDPTIYSAPIDTIVAIGKLRIPKGASDFDLAEAALVIDKPKLVGDIVSEWKKHGRGLPTVVFATGVRHSINIRDAFRAAGVRAEHIDSNTPEEERDRILAALASGEVQVVTNCDVLTEGWDLPACKCAIIARPTASRSKSVQMSGRILRYHLGTKPIILDHVGNVFRHDFPTVDVPVSLERKEKRSVGNGAGGASIPRVCPQCLLVSRADVKVCACGYCFPKTEREIAQERADLEEVDRRRMIEEQVRKAAASIAGADETLIQHVLRLRGAA